MKTLQTTGTGFFTVGGVRYKYEREKTIMNPKMLNRNGGINMGLSFSKHIDIGVN